VVEFDEYGDFFDTEQLMQSLKMIGAVEGKPLLVTFVHGWRHNASPGDEDLIDLQNLVTRLNSMEGLKGYTACGLYIGWRGARVDESKLPGLVTAIPAGLTFWNRKAATDRVADIGLARVLSHTSKAAWKDSGRVITIGHSFGGRILEKCIGNSMAAQSATLDTIKPLADFTVFVNPASESLTARKLKLALKGWDRDDTKSVTVPGSDKSALPPPPLMVAIGAQNDKATGFLWPLGYGLAKLFGRIPKTNDYLNTGNSKPDKQAPYLRLTTTNDQYQHTHMLELITGNQPALMGSEQILSRNLSDLKASANARIFIRSSDGLASAWRLQELSTVSQKPWTKTFGRLGQRREINHVVGSKAYWVFNVPKEILSGHGGSQTQGVITDQMLDLLVAMIGRANLADRKDGGPQVKVNFASMASSSPTE